MLEWAPKPYRLAEDRMNPMPKYLLKLHDKSRGGIPEPLGPYYTTLKTLKTKP